MSYPDHCSDCTETKGCGGLHVYVIELVREHALANKSFLKKNPRIDGSFKGRCFYVGQTSHNPECRYKGHAGRRKRYWCSCMTNEPKLRLKEDGNKPSKVTGPSKCLGLRPYLYKHLNPVAKASKAGQEKVKEAEGELARELIEAGHAAYSDRLDMQEPATPRRLEGK